MTVITRFPPSPTGILHIGNARTALFNYLYARHCGGTFLLRVEDTDKERSTPEAVEAIFEGMDWLGLEHDGEVVFQSSRFDRHREVADKLLAEGKAYHCYATQEELAAMREEQKANGQTMRYDGRWRDRDPSEAPDGISPVVRLKMPQEGATTIDDLVQGEVTVENKQLDDMILLRADGTPTYMLSVVVDDADMGVTHVIRGDDHLNNAFRQYQLYIAMGADVPRFGHMPLIHGPDGKKLSKRHGDLGVGAYRDMGYLPETMCNYLSRLGWSHGDDEIFSMAQAIEWFDVVDVGRSPARLDFDKLADLNGHYIRQADNARLVDLALPILEEKLELAIDEVGKARLLAGMDGLKQRAKTVHELAEGALCYVRPRPLVPDEKAANALDSDARVLLRELGAKLPTSECWTEEAVGAEVKAFAEEKGLKLGKVAQPLRAALCGTMAAPGIFEVMLVLGPEECLARLGDL